MTPSGKPLKAWNALDSGEQNALQAAYQAELDRQPATCSLDEKVVRFAAWLAERGVAFSADDLKRRPR